MDDCWLPTTQTSRDKNPSDRDEEEDHSLIQHMGEVHSILGDYACLEKNPIHMTNGGSHKRRMKQKMIARLKGKKKNKTSTAQRGFIPDTHQGQRAAQHQHNLRTSGGSAVDVEHQVALVQRSLSLHIRSLRTNRVDWSSVQRGIGYELQAAMNAANS